MDNIVWGVCSGGCLLWGVCLLPGGGGIPSCTEADPPCSNVRKSKIPKLQKYSGNEV